LEESLAQSKLDRVPDPEDGRGDEEEVVVYYAGLLLVIFGWGSGPEGRPAIRVGRPRRARDSDPWITPDPCKRSR
jgi:hypothetical protein